MGSKTLGPRSDGAEQVRIDGYCPSGGPITIIVIAAFLFDVYKKNRGGWARFCFDCFWFDSCVRELMTSAQGAGFELL